MTSADKKAAEEKAEVAKLQASQLRFSDAHIWLSVSAALYNLFVDGNSAVGIYISTAYFAADVALFSKLFHPSDFFHHALGLLSGYIALEYDEKKLYCLNQVCEISTYFLNQYHRDKSLRSSQYFAASFFLVRVVFPTVYTLPWAYTREKANGTYGLVLSTVFVMLQYYWFFLIVLKARQTMRKGKETKRGEEDKKREEKEND